ncbi:hypothetical protein EFR84_15205 [Rhizobium chutanense]|uniref:Uncharacterized protein n=1 Tax=Rhizobium chutanense TaxID=2035448 RepID=A0A432P253_9HYPH|nr:hypothetical protein EFR84_15205 [Rhizobium chutanense]
MTDLLGDCHEIAPERACEPPDSCVCRLVEIVGRRSIESFTARTRGGWIPVTSTGMREGNVACRQLP